MSQTDRKSANADVHPYAVELSKRLNPDNRDAIDIDESLFSTLAMMFYNKFNLSSAEVHNYRVILCNSLKCDVNILPFEPNTYEIVGYILAGSKIHPLKILPKEDEASVLDAVRAIRRDYIVNKEREDTFVARVPKPKYQSRRAGRPAKDATTDGISASDHLKKYYGPMIEYGNYIASDLKSDDPNLYNALVYEAHQSNKTLSDYIPTRESRHESIRENLAIILDSSVDEAAQYFGAARRSRGGGRIR